MGVTTQQRMRPLLLRHRTLPRPQETYQGKSWRCNPSKLYHPVYTLLLDTAATVSQRTVPDPATAQRSPAPLHWKRFDIRRYPVQTDGELAHPIEKLMLSFHGCKLSQIQHLLLPLEAILDVHDKTFYTVSEHANLTIEGLRRGIKQWPYMFCHDDYGFVLKQILTGVEVLVTRGLQHDQINLQNIVITEDGVVKIAAIDRITDGDPWGWNEMSKSLIQLAAGLKERLSQAQNLGFIRQAMGLHLSTIAGLASIKMFHEATPPGPPGDRPDLLALGGCQPRTLEEDNGLVKKRILRRPKFGLVENKRHVKKRGWYRRECVETEFEAEKGPT
ncbi:hypothetical protein N7523_005574 [Penicillium sp. IBT 18751x]|nr:hypothetical protein N7523_005574 [Penicillium sp. IBT 18751x]